MAFPPNYQDIPRASGVPLEEISQDDIVIAFMGPTGTGKSTFIDLLTQEGRRAGKNLESVTHMVEATCVLHPQTGKRIVLVDTPGFDDTYMTELQVLQLVADWLQRTYKLNIKLFGIVYLHSIADRRMKGSVVKNLRMFERLCGELAMASIVITTTMWKDVTTEDGIDRETQLISKFWQPMIDQGATVDRLKVTSYDEAWRVLNGLIKKRTGIEREALWLQTELVELRRKLNETEAGKELYASLKELLDRAKNQRKNIRTMQREADDPKALKDLDRELMELEARIEALKEDATKLRIPLSRRLHKFFTGK